MMNVETEQQGDLRFVTGLLVGSVVGAALIMWLVPKVRSAIRTLVHGAPQLERYAADAETSGVL